VFSVNITNITNFSVSFDIRYPARNLGTYDIDPVSAVMTPCSTQRIVVKMTPKNKELEDGQYEDALTVYSHLVREGVIDHIYYEVGKEFPIVYKKVISLIMQLMGSNFNSVLSPSEINQEAAMIVESSYGLEHPIPSKLSKSVSTLVLLPPFWGGEIVCYSATHTRFNLPY
jgi:hypothetical protein